MNKYFKYLLIILSSLIFANLQISFFNNLNLNYLFLIILVILSIFKFNLAINFAFWLGIFLDFFNQTSFGLISFSLVITIYLINLLFINYLIHKNFLTYLVLIAIGFFIFNFIVLTINLLFLIIGQSLIYFEIQNFIYIFKQFFYHLVLFLILYFIFVFISKKFMLRKYEY